MMSIAKEMGMNNDFCSWYDQLLICMRNKLKEENEEDVTIEETEEILIRDSINNFDTGWGLNKKEEFIATVFLIAGYCEERSYI